MTTQFHPYTAADFLRVRDFLVRTHDTVGETHNSVQPLWLAEHLGEDASAGGGKRR